MGTILNGLLLGLIASPSCPSNAQEIRAGTRHGSLHALAVALGAVAGDAFVLVLLVLGLQPVLEEVRALTILLWAAGALVLGYVAWGIFVEARDVVGAEQEAAAGDGAGSGLAHAAWLGFAITTFNPFTIVWWLGLLGPALTEGEGLPLAFALAVLVGAAAWFVGLAGILRLGRRWLTQRVRRWILIVSGVGALGYAAYFAWRALQGALA